MGKFRIGDIVKIDTDNKEWGRVASEGDVVHVDRITGRVMINAYTIRARIYVPQRDIRLLQRPSGTGKIPDIAKKWAHDDLDASLETYRQRKGF